MLLKESIKKKYKEFNITVLILFICVIFLPKIIHIIKKYLPDVYEIFRCPYYMNNKVPCPFCGITTDFKNILIGNISNYKYNLISVPLILVSVIEFNLRSALIIYNKKIKSYKILLIDCIYHISLILILAIYIIIYFKFKLARF